MLLSALHIDDGSCVHVSSLHEVEDKCDSQHAAKHDNRVVHALRRYGRRHWKADPDHSKAAVHERKEVDGQTELAERPSGSWELLATEALQSDGSNGDGIGRHEGEQLQGDDGVARGDGQLSIGVVICIPTHKAIVLPRLMRLSRIVNA